MFRFTKRDMLWLMVVVGLAAAWWVDHDKLRAKTIALQWHVAVLKAKNVAPHGPGLITEQDAVRRFRAFAGPAEPNP